MPDLRPPAVSRRRFLASAGGAAAGLVLLGACGDDDDAEPSGTTAAANDLVLAAYMAGPFHAAGIESRLVFGLADTQGLLTYEDTPEQLELAILGPDGLPAADPVTVQRHGEGLPRAYFPLRATLDEPGIYTLRAELEGQAAAELAFEVKDPAQITVVKPGDQMPPSQTPTTADARGVTPICTAEPGVRAPRRHGGRGARRWSAPGAARGHPQVLQGLGLRAGPRRAAVRRGRPPGRALPPRGGLPAPGGQHGRPRAGARRPADVRGAGPVPGRLDGVVRERLDSIYDAVGARATRSSKLS